MSSPSRAEPRSSASGCSSTDSYPPLADRRVGRRHGDPDGDRKGGGARAGGKKRWAHLASTSAKQRKLQCAASAAWASARCSAFGFWRSGSSATGRGAKHGEPDPSELWDGEEELVGRQFFDPTHPEFDPGWEPHLPTVVDADEVTGLMYDDLEPQHPLKGLYDVPDAPQPPDARAAPVDHALGRVVPAARQRRGDPRVLAVGGRGGAAAAAGVRPAARRRARRARAPQLRAPRAAAVDSYAVSVCAVNRRGNSDFSEQVRYATTAPAPTVSRRRAADGPLRRRHARDGARRRLRLRLRFQVSPRRQRRPGHARPPAARAARRAAARRRRRRRRAALRRGERVGVRVAVLRSGRRRRRRSRATHPRRRGGGRGCSTARCSPRRRSTWRSASPSTACGTSTCTAASTTT